MRVVVIGSGVNERVAANYLALARHEVTLVRERADASDDALEPGWIPPKIVSDLDLGRHGLRIHAPDPWAAAAAQGARLELTREVEGSARAIRRFSARDADRWREFCERTYALARVLEKLYLAPPPDPLARSLEGLMRLGRTALGARGLGRRGIEDLLRLLTMPVADWLDEWFESDVLKGVLGAGGVMDLAQGPRSGGTAFNLLHHCVGSPCGVFRPPLTNAAAALAKRADAAVRDGAVTRIDVRKGRVTAVVLEGGLEIGADVVVSGEPPARTLLELTDPGLLDPELVRSVRSVRSRGAAARVSLALDRDPGFTTLVVAPSLDYLERAYDAVKYGGVSAAPYVEARYSGTPGHAVDLHVQYVPRTPGAARWGHDGAEKLASSAIGRIAESVPGFRDWIAGQTVTTPVEIEAARHAELALDQILWMRPVPELAQYRTPIAGLYLCGPSMHPGAGIAGAAGANAARVVIRDLKKG